jgi:hypothetical protein
MNDIGIMPRNNSQQRHARSGQLVVVGRARDGVEILRQRSGPSSFTRQQANRVVDRVKDSRAGSSASEPVPDPALGDAK